MTTPNELEKLKAAMREASAAERPDPADRAAGLERLLAAEAAAPPPSSRGKLAVRAGVLATIALLIAWWFSMRGPAVTPRPVVIPEVVDAGAPPLVVVVPPPAIVEPEPPPTVVELVDAGTQPAKPAAKPQPSEEDPDLLARELALLDRARQQLHTQTPGALATLDAYDKEFPKGSLRIEAQLVRLEVLMKLDRRDDATRLAAKLIAKDRDGLVKKRVERIIEAP
jgi:hypothetical protein